MIELSTGSFIKVIVISLVIVNTKVTVAQSMKGITHKPDTGYTNYSALKNDKAKYPDISLVPVQKNMDLSEQKNIVYCKQGNRELVLDVFSRKEQNEGRVAFIMVHGGGWRTGNRMQHYPLAQALAALGYVCFTPEYRLSTEALFPAAIYDIKAAIRWVKANAGKYKVDTSKIVIAGFSAGGEIAAFMGATGNMPLFQGPGCNPAFNTIVNAVVDIDGTLSFTQPESGEGDDSRSTSAATHWFGYGKKENTGLWDAASPLSYAGSQTPPTLFLNSSVAHMHAGREDYINILNSYGIYTEVHEFEDAPHSFPLYDRWFTPMVNYIDRFLKKVFAVKP